MEIPFQIETHDRMVSYDLLEAKEIQLGQQKIISEGVSIRVEGLRVRKAFGLPEIVNMTLMIGQNVALPIALGILSSYLYDKLKNRKDTNIIINYSHVEIKAEKIEIAISNFIEKENK